MKTMKNNWTSNAHDKILCFWFFYSLSRSTLIFSAFVNLKNKHTHLKEKKTKNWIKK